jgi:D-alanine--poly(phosphoribitol) ligase subunit 1
MSLNKLLNEYLGYKFKKYVIADQNENISIIDFRIKVLHYIEIISQKKIEIGSNFGIAIYIERSIDYIAIIFACFLTKTYYVPLSISSKKVLFKNQIKQSKVSFLFLKKNKKILFVSVNKKIKKIKNHNLAYIIFTSGSTGDKKGVKISRTSFLSYIKSIKAVSKKNKYFKSLLINGELTFDISLADFAFAIVYKSKIIVTENSNNLISLFYLIKKYYPEAIYAVPTTWERIIHFSKNFRDIKFDKIKYLNSGGEVLKKNLVSKMYKIFPKSRITNFYGPTEFTINASFFQISKRNFAKYEVMPLGKMLPGVKMKILYHKNNNKNIGELLLGGKQIMTGYVNYKNPIKYINSIAFYPTGDYVKLDAKGLLHYVSRKNDYQKISGYRIDVIGIEKKINYLIKKEVLLINENSKLFLFIFGQKKLNLKENKILNNFLQNKLEDYEKPKNIIYLIDKPINTSGKIDTKKLKELINE